MLTENLADCWNQSWKLRHPTVKAITKTVFYTAAWKQKSHFLWKCLFSVCVKCQFPQLFRSSVLAFPSLYHMFLSARPLHSSGLFLFICCLLPHFTLNDKAACWWPGWASNAELDRRTTLSGRGPPLQAGTKSSWFIVPWPEGHAAWQNTPWWAEASVWDVLSSRGQTGIKSLLFQSRGFPEHETFGFLG